MPEQATLSIPAHAKLNLVLSVGPPIADGANKGFHPIASWFVPIDLHDTLRLERLPEGSPSRFDIRWAADAPKPSPIDWPIDKDLAVRAHNLLERHAARSLPVAMTLDKRVPVGGGLGGGSSDAAAMLTGLNRLFGLGISAADLRALSVRLGSDVAFFIDDDRAGRAPRAALVTGLGDRIERLERSPTSPVVLIFPPFGCPTGPVYKAFDRRSAAALAPDRVRSLVEHASETGRIDDSRLFNDLAEPACAVEPGLRDALARIRAACPGLHAHVTGSGSTMFVLPAAPDVESTLQAIAGSGAGLVSVAARMI